MRLQDYFPHTKNISVIWERPLTTGELETINLYIQVTLTLLVYCTLQATSTTWNGRKGNKVAF